jgi:hypothetical protein
MTRWCGTVTSRASDAYGAAIFPLPMAVALAALVVLSASCAALISGTTQTVPITSQPPHAEVFVDGVSAGFTPVELELERDRDHTVVVRLAGQERTVVLRSGTQIDLVVLDLVPVVASGGVLVSLYASDFFVYGLPQLEPFAWGLVAVSFAPLLIDVGAGALQELTPGEIIVAFDGP